MQKSLITFLLLAALLPADAQTSDTPKVHIGTVQASWDKLTETPGLLHLIGHARIASDDYDFYAADIRVASTPGAKAGVSGIKEAVAAGGAIPNTQVVAHVRQPLQSVSYEIYSDRAVYQPDASRPSGGTLKFTGHVKVITKSGFLAVPSVYTTDTATILLGVGADYPEVSTGPGHLTLTPAQ